jgi:hypothetical protein
MYHGKSKDIKETAGSDIRALFATQQQQSIRKSRKKYSAD